MNKKSTVSRKSILLAIDHLRRLKHESAVNNTIVRGGFSTCVFCKEAGMTGDGRENCNKCILHYLFYTKDMEDSLSPACGNVGFSSHISHVNSWLSGITDKRGLMNIIRTYMPKLIKLCRQKRIKVHKWMLNF